MIIANTSKLLVAAVHDSTGAQFTSATVAVIRLEQPGDASDGYYWTGAAWNASSASSPAATHLEAGLHSYTLPAGATTGRAGAVIHYTFTDDLTEGSATTVCSGGEHYVRAEDPIATSDIPSAATIADSVWDEAAADHGTAGSTGAALAAASPSVGANQVTITVQTSGAVPIADVKVTVRNSGDTATLTVQTTDSNGQVTAALDDGTYKVRLSKAGYGFTVPETLTVDEDPETATYTAVSLSLDPAPDPDYCRVQNTAPLMDVGGNVLAGYTIKFIATTPQSAQSAPLTSAVVTATTDDDGYFYVDLLRDAVVKVVAIEAGYYDSDTKTVPDAATQDFADWS